jgi:hypothetical protein
MSRKVLSDLDFGSVARGINHLDPVNPQDVATRAFVLANRTALSLMGRSANSAGPPADIVSTTDDRLMTRVASVLAWTQLTLGMIADGLLTNAKLFPMGVGTVKGRAIDAGSSGPPQDLTGAEIGALITGVAPVSLGNYSNNMAVPFVFRVGFAAGTPGTPDDVTITLASPFPAYLTDIQVMTSTGIVGSTGTLRSGTGGGGVALSTAIPTSAAGNQRETARLGSNIISAGTPLYWRRSDRGVAGEVIISALR